MMISLVFFFFRIYSLRIMEENFLTDRDFFVDLSFQNSGSSSFADSQPIFSSSSVSLLTAETLIMEFIIKNGVSWTAASALIILIQTILPKPNSFPTSLFHLRKSFESKENPLYILLYCPESDCEGKVLLGVKREGVHLYKCKKCGKFLNIENEKRDFSFVYMPIGPQISQILSNSQIQTELLSSLKDSQKCAHIMFDEYTGTQNFITQWLIQ